MAFGRVPFAAVIVPGKVPATLGVPDITPAELNVSPVGRVPEVTAKVTGVVPDALQVKL